MADMPVKRNSTFDIAIARTRSGALALMNKDESKVDRYLRCAKNESLRNTTLELCDQNSIGQCILTAMSANIELGSTLGQGWLVPYKTKKGGYVCQLIVGYKGLLKLVYNSGYVKDCYAENVFKNDTFSFAMGSCPKIEHTYDVTGTGRGEYIGTYAVAHTVLGGTVQSFMNKDEMESIKKRSSSFRNGNSPWITDEDEMRKKTALRRICKVLPSSILPIEVHNALEQEDAREFRNAREVDIIVETPLPIEASSPVGAEGQGGGGDCDASPSTVSPPGNASKKQTVESLRNALTTILKEFDPDEQENICNEAGLLESIKECEDIGLLTKAYELAEKKMEAK